jgi:CheY-like chemotaxis protein
MTQSCKYQQRYRRSAHQQDENLVKIWSVRNFVYLMILQTLIVLRYLVRGVCVRVLIVDDQDFIRRGLRALLSEEPDIKVVGQALDGHTAIEIVRILKPDVVVMDISMPIMDGLQATREIRHFWPDVHVVTVSQYEVVDIWRDAVKAGALAHIPKTEVWDKLVPTLRSLPIENSAS